MADQRHGFKIKIFKSSYLFHKYKWAEPPPLSAFGQDHDMKSNENEIMSCEAVKMRQLGECAMQASILAGLAFQSSLDASGAFCCFFMQIQKYNLLQLQEMPVGLSFNKCEFKSAVPTFCSESIHVMRNNEKGVASWPL